jgi:hypothetical protein
VTEEVDITCTPTGAGQELGEPVAILGKVKAMGVPTRTKLGTAAVDFDDKDGDGLEETFEATLANSTLQTSPARPFL